MAQNRIDGDEIENKASLEKQYEADDLQNPCSEFIAPCIRHINFAAECVLVAMLDQKLIFRDMPLNVSDGCFAIWALSQSISVVAG